jgi:hypothetical protein
MDRYFTINNINGRQHKGGGRYKGETPINAAKKIGAKLCDQYKKNRITFSITETTKDSKKKTYNYVAVKSRDGVKVSSANKRVFKGGNENNIDVTNISVDTFRDYIKNNKGTKTVLLRTTYDDNKTQFDENMNTLFDDNSTDDDYKRQYDIFKERKYLPAKYVLVDNQKIDIKYNVSKLELIIKDSE